MPKSRKEKQKVIEAWLLEAIAQKQDIINTMIALNPSSDLIEWSDMLTQWYKDIEFHRIMKSPIKLN